MAESTETPTGGVAGWYERHIGPPVTGGEVYGYLAYVLGVVLGLVGFVAFYLSLGEVRGTDAFWTYREAAFALGALGFVLLVVGSLVRFTLRRRATQLGVLGAVVSTLATVWFVVAYPDAWNVESGDQSGVVLPLFAAGVVLMALAGIVVPTVTSRTETKAEREASASRVDAAERRADEAEMRAETAEREVADARERREAAERRADEAEARAGAAERRADEAEERVGSLDRRVEVAEERADAAERRATEAERHADDLERRAAEAEKRAGTAEQRATEAVGAADETDEEGEQRTTAGTAGAPETVAERTDEVDDLQADLDRVLDGDVRFEVVEADDGWRWRLAGEDGTVLATSEERFASHDAAVEAAERVARGTPGIPVFTAPPAEATGEGPTRFVVYEGRGAAGSWRWRCYRDGTVLATGGQGFSSRRNARKSALLAREHLATVDGVTADSRTVELVRNRSGKWGWRLRDGDDLLDRSESRFESRRGALRAAFASLAADDEDTGDDANGE